MGGNERRVLWSGDQKGLSEIFMLKGRGLGLFGEVLSAVSLADGQPKVT